MSYGRDGAAEVSAASAAAAWGGSVEVHRAAAVAKSRFMAALEAADGEEGADEAAWEAHQATIEASARDLDGGAGVTYWTDYCKARVRVPHGVVAAGTRSASITRKHDCGMMNAATAPRNLLGGLGDTSS